MNRQESKIAALILVMVAASGALMYRGMSLDRNADRLGAIRTLSVGGQEHLALFYAKQLHLLDASGRRVGRQPLADLLLTEEPTDMDWTQGPDGQAQAWFFEDTAPRLVRCDLVADKVRLERCAQLAAGAQLKVEAHSEAIHIAVDAARKRMFIADAKGHAVQVVSLDGRVLGRSVQGDLFFPNRLRLAGDALMVADNDHRRLVWLDIRDDKPSFALRSSLAASAHPQARGGHSKVTDFAFLPGQDGRPAVLWMLAVAQGQKDGNVLLWGAGLKPIARADLGEFTDPLAIDRLGAAAVVADFEGVALNRIGERGQYLGAFGEEAFQRELRSSRDQIAASALWTQAGWTSFALTLVIGFLLAWRYSEKPGQQIAVQAFAGLGSAVAQVPRGTVELKPQAWYGRRIAIAGAVGTLLILVVTGLLFSVFPHEQPPSVLGKAAVAIGLVPLAWVAMAFALWQALGQGRRRLVLAKGFAQVHSGDSIVASVPVLQVVASPQALLIERTLLPYRGVTVTGRPGRWIYDQDKLTRYLLAHLPAGQLVAHPDLARAVVRRTPLWQKLLVGLPMAALLGLLLWRALVR